MVGSVNLQAMTQFHVSPETLPRDVGPYPPVVHTLYEKWAMEAEERKQGGNEEEEWRKVVEGEEADWGDRLVGETCSYVTLHVGMYIICDYTDCM